MRRSKLSPVVVMSPYVKKGTISSTISIILFLILNCSLVFNEGRRSTEDDLFSENNKLTSSDDDESDVKDRRQLSSNSVVSVSDTLSWSDEYVVEGDISIPYAEIHEPFKAYFDKSSSKSRVDYYNGMDKTFQRGDIEPFGKMFKVVPMTTEVVKNQINCFEVNGTSQSPTAIQSVLPDVSGFKYVRDEVLDDVEGSCERWVRYDKPPMENGKTSKYIVWVQRVKSPLNPDDLNVAIPVKFEMKGFNMILGSHYDHYILTYKNYVPKLDDKSIFDDYKEAAPCHGMPGPGVEGHDSISHHLYTFNPMREFIPEAGAGSDVSGESTHQHTSHVDHSFRKFVAFINKSYETIKHEILAHSMFTHNMRFIHSTNRRQKSYSLKPNHMTDWTKASFNKVRGKLYSKGYNGGRKFQYSEREVRSLPNSVNWVLRGAVTPVKDQAICGSCWAFGTVGTLEGALFVKSGKLRRLSEQALVDCSWGYGNNGCDGGEDFRVYQFMLKNNGIPSSDEYGPYLGQDGRCHFNESSSAFQISHFVNVTANNVEAMKVALNTRGPISVAIDASHRTFGFYANGVYDDSACKNGPEDLDHAVLAVGYGTNPSDNREYWLIKNSWSTYWGLDGYVLMEIKDNKCGVLTMPTFPVPA